MAKLATYLNMKVFPFAKVDNMQEGWGGGLLARVMPKNVDISVTIRTSSLACIASFPGLGTRLQLAVLEPCIGQGRYTVNKLDLLATIFW